MREHRCQFQFGWFDSISLCEAQTVRGFRCRGFARYPRRRPMPGSKLLGGLFKSGRQGQPKPQNTQHDIEIVDLLGKLSHELRSPLSGVIGFAEVLKESKPSEERHSHYVSLIHTSGINMLAMIDAAVIYARTRTDKLEMKPEKCDLVAMIERVISKVKVETGSKVSVAVDWAGDREFVVSRERLEAVLSRIVDNAVRFGSENPVAISGAVAQGTPRRLELTVIDRGIGMTEEDAAAALTPLGKLKSKPKGAHAGARMSLAIVREFARACGGLFSLESEPSQGTRATLIMEELPN
jgi:signal transduction histidine kinase